MYSFSQILIGILKGEKMNVLLKRIMLQLIHLVFFSRIVDMWNTPPLPIRQATTIARFKKGVRYFLGGNVWGFLIIIIIILLIVFLYISPYAFFSVLIVCLLRWLDPVFFFGGGGVPSYFEAVWHYNPVTFTPIAKILWYIVGWSICYPFCVLDLR